MLGEILDDLLTSPSTGPCITATRHFAPRPPVLAAPARRARPLSLPDEGARPGPARGARGVGEEPARDADVHLRRRHAPRRAACRPRAGESRADEPRHAPLGDPPAPYEMGDALPESSLCRHRRAPRVPGRLRQP